jgi:predicted CopG family antitoxin
LIEVFKKIYDEMKKNNEAFDDVVEKLRETNKKGISQKER